MRYEPALDHILWESQPHTVTSTRGAVVHVASVASYDHRAPRVRIAQVRETAGRVVARRAIGSLDAATARAVAQLLLDAADAADQLGDGATQ